MGMVEVGVSKEPGLGLTKSVQGTFPHSAFT